MKRLSILLSALSFFTCGITIRAQNAIPATGGNAAGGGGSVSYSVGQVFYTKSTGSNGTVSQGVQQPYEISIVTAIRNTEGITLECAVYPNPTRGIIKLVVRTNDFTNLRFQLYDLNGILLQDKKVESAETEIFMDNLMPSTFFLKVFSADREIKTFKIIKN